MRLCDDDIYVNMWEDRHRWAIEPDNFSKAAEWRMLQEGYYVPRGQDLPHGRQPRQLPRRAVFRPGAAWKRSSGKGLFRYWPLVPVRGRQVGGMIGSVERYSSAANRRSERRSCGRLLRVLLIALILYLVVSRFLVSTYRIESVSMEPALAPADRVDRQPARLRPARAVLRTPASRAWGCPSAGTSSWSSRRFST